MESRNYSISGASEVLGVKVRTIRQWIRDGKIKAQKYSVSNRWFIPAEEIDRIQSTRSDGDANES